MTTYVLPDDKQACGNFRLAWPAQDLIDAGHDIRVQFSDQRTEFGAGIDKHGNVAEAYLPADATTVVMQRVTHRHWAECFPLWRQQGVKVVLDIDDDLSALHAQNHAWGNYHSDPDRTTDILHQAALAADVVTVTTPALAARYRADAVILPNFLPEHYFGLPRTDSTDLMWPAVIGSHPNDPQVLGPALRQVKKNTGARVLSAGKSPAQLDAYFRALGVQPDLSVGYVSLEDWPMLLSSIGVAFVPLADTLFNAAKSRLKVLELSAVGVPWVASPREDYLQFGREAGVGVFAERPNEWRRELNRLVTDDGWRKHQSDANREAALAYRLRDHVGLWAIAWGLD